MRGRAPLGPAALAERLAALPLVIEDRRVELRHVQVADFYDGGRRPSAILVLRGRGAVGRGENVGWTTDEQRTFVAACESLDLGAATSVGAVATAARGCHRYHRTAIEGAAIDLALRQAATSMFAASGRHSRPVTFCWSLTAAADPTAAVERVLDARPEATIKIDCPPEGWADDVIRRLAATGRIVTVDFKRTGDPARVAHVHERLPEAWLEDPPDGALRNAAGTRWHARVSLDGYVQSAADLERPPIRPAAINVKAPRVGGWLEALRCLGIAEREGWKAYVGGMFEVGVGRVQARVLASLFTADAPNDLAPIRRSPDEPYLASPVELDGTSFG